MDSKVFVIGLTGKRLMPTTPAKARKLLEQKKAEVYLKRPFTIRLLYKTGGAIQETILGIDTGSQHIGVAVVANGAAVYKADIELRNTMEKRKLMESRKTYRRSRRYRKVRYRHPKFKFHTKRVYVEEKILQNKHLTHWKKLPSHFTSDRQEGWLPPSIQSKCDHHFAWIDRYMDVLPKGRKLHLEVGRFDVARMKNPTIHGELYQRGPQYDYQNVKAYVFDRDHYKCKVCGAKGGSVRKDGTVVKLKAHHLDFRSEGSTDNPERMVTVCDHCHTAANHNDGGILAQWRKEGKVLSRGYRDATFMNILRRRMFERYPEAVFTYGNITAADRDRLLILKGHANDAVAIAAKDLEKVKNQVATIYFKQVRKKKRSLHEATPRKGRKFPNRDAVRNSKNTKESKGFSLWDKVSVYNQCGWISGFSNGGLSARIVDTKGKFIHAPGKEYSTVQLSMVKRKCRNNNWICYQSLL